MFIIDGFLPLIVINPISLSKPYRFRGHHCLIHTCTFVNRGDTVGVGLGFVKGGIYFIRVVRGEVSHVGFWDGVGGRGGGEGQFGVGTYFYYFSVTASAD